MPSLKRSQREDAGTITDTDYGFTGQQNLPGLGLMDYKARMYDPFLGRFVQADTIIPEAGKAGAYDRYAYSNNNPINYTDPTGHIAIDTNLDEQENTTSLGLLIDMFASDSLSGDSCIERLDAIYKETVKVPGLLYTKGDYDDSGFKEEYQDPWPSSDNQVGHFITAVKYGEYAAKRSKAQNIALNFVIGHEMVGDNIPLVSNIIQVAVGANHQETHPWFLSGKDTEFTKILNITSDSIFGPPETRQGNSIQDLRLSYMGWNFAQLVYGGELTSRQQCANWIQQNLGN